MEDSPRNPRPPRKSLFPQSVILVAKARYYAGNSFTTKVPPKKSSVILSRNDAVGKGATDGKLLVYEDKHEAKPPGFDSPNGDAIN